MPFLFSGFEIQSVSTSVGIPAALIGTHFEANSTGVWIKPVWSLGCGLSNHIWRAIEEYISAYEGRMILAALNKSWNQKGEGHLKAFPSLGLPT